MSQYDLDIKGKHAIHFKDLKRFHKSIHLLYKIQIMYMDHQEYSVL